jgi:heme-degrading monooxygenase HmoA
MHARLSRFAGLPPERIDETLQAFEQGALPQFEQLAGYKGVLVAVNHAEGKAAAITFWDTRDNMRESDKLADRAREAALEQAQGSSEPTREPIVDHYEVMLDRRS